MLPSNVVFPVPIDEDHRVQFVGGVLPGAGLGPGVPIDEDHGVGVNINHETFVVESILIGSDAEFAEVKIGDVVTEVDGQPIKDFRVFKQRIAGPMGSHVNVTFTKTVEEAVRMESYVGEPSSSLEPPKRVVTVTRELMRGPAPYIRVRREISLLQKENDSLRSQVQGALGEGADGQNLVEGLRSKICSMENEHAFMMEQFALVSMKQQERKQEIIDKMSEDSIVCAKLANCIKQVQYYQEELQHSKDTISQLEDTIIKHKEMIIQLGEQLVDKPQTIERHEKEIKGLPKRTALGGTGGAVNVETQTELIEAPGKALLDELRKRLGESEKMISSLNSSPKLRDQAAAIKADEDIVEGELESCRVAEPVAAKKVGLLGRMFVRLRRKSGSGESISNNTSSALFSPSTSVSTTPRKPEGLASMPESADAVDAGSAYSVAPVVPPANEAPQDLEHAKKAGAQRSQRSVAPLQPAMPSALSTDPTKSYDECVSNDKPSNPNALVGVSPNQEEADKEAAAVDVQAPELLHLNHLFQWDEAVPFTFTLDMDLKSIGDEEVFKKDLITDVATAAKIDAKHLRVTALRAGSVIVDMLIAKAAGDAQEIVRDLEEQMGDMRSLFMKGKVTSKRWTREAEANARATEAKARIKAMQASFDAREADRKKEEMIQALLQDDTFQASVVREQQRIAPGLLQLHSDFLMEAHARARDTPPSVRPIISPVSPLAGLGSSGWLPSNRSANKPPASTSLYMQRSAPAPSVSAHQAQLTNTQTSTDAGTWGLWNDKQPSDFSLVPREMLKTTAFDDFVPESSVGLKQYSVKHYSVEHVPQGLPTPGTVPVSVPPSIQDPKGHGELRDPSFRQSVLTGGNYR